VKAGVLAGILLLLWLLRPIPVFAHAVLVASYPADGGVLTAPPAFVHLWFSEPVEPIAHSITVLDPSGRHVERGPLRANGLEVGIAVDAARRGTYLVRWSVISIDTHPAGGSFVFSVGHAGGPFASAGQSAGVVSPLGLALQVAARWLHAAGYALGFGPPAFALLIPRPRKPGALLIVNFDAQVERRLWRLVTVGIAALLLAEPVALFGQTASLGNTELGGLVDPAILTAVMASSFGRALAQRLGAALLLWALIGAVKAGVARAIPAVLLLGCALALIDGEASHAANAGPLWLGLTLNAAHVMAMGLWVGGLATLLSVWTLTEREDRAALAGRFGRVAGASLALLAATGVIMAYLRLRGPADLFVTPYGQALTIKTAVVCLVALLALAGTRAHGGGHAGWWRLELVTLLGVLALAGLLVSLPPPR